MMSALHNGQIRTMKANYRIEAGDVRVIRPFVYVREATTRDFSVAAKLPIINENCPACFEQPKVCESPIPDIESPSNLINQSISCSLFAHLLILIFNITLSFSLTLFITHTYMYTYKY